MNLYDGPTAASSAPALPAAVAPGYYTNGVPGSVPRTDIEDWHLNAIQEEIVNAIAGAGLTPTRTDNTQLLAAIRALIEGGALTFTPVQQGGGPGQDTTKLNLGWDGAQLLLAVAGSAEGAVALKSDLAAAVSTLDALIASDIAPLATTTALNAAVATINTALALLAPLISPALTGTPTVPTAAAGTNTTQIASTAFVKTAVGAAVDQGNVSSVTGPWWTWNPVTGEVHIRGQYNASITAEGAITVNFPVNVGTFQTAQATTIQNSNAASTIAQVDSWTATTLTVFMQDNQGGSGASAQGFMWEVWGYSPTLPHA